MSENLDNVINFSDDEDYKRFFPENTAISPFVTDPNGLIFKYCQNLKGEKIDPGRECEEGCVVAIRPEKTQNIADEKYWYALVVGTNENGGDVKIRWYASGAYTLMSIDDRLHPPLVSNKTEFQEQLESFDVVENAMYLTNSEDSVAYTAIKCVLTVAEFDTLNFDENIRIVWSGTECRIV